MSARSGRLVPLAVIGTMVLLLSIDAPWAIAGGVPPGSDIGAKGGETIRAGGEGGGQGGLVVSLSPQSSSVLGGGSLTLVTSYSDNDPVLGGTQSYSWSLSSEVSGYLSDDSGSSATFDSFDVANTTTATIEVTMDADQDGAPFFVSATAYASVTVASTLLAGTLSASPDPSSPGEPVNLSLKFSGGIPPYTVSFNCGDGSVVAEDLPSGGLASVKHIYTGGTFTPTATISDASGQTSSASTQTTLIVSSGLAASINAPRAVDVDEEVNLSSTVSGGMSPYTYQWSDSEGTSYDGTGAWSIQPPTTGTITVSLIVTDSLDNVVSAHSVTIEVAPRPSLSLGSMETTADLGTPFPLYATVTGGLAPYSLTWSDGFEDASSTTSFLGAGTFTLPYSFGKPGSLSISAVLADSQGETSYVDASLGQVVPLPSVNLTYFPANPMAGSNFTLYGDVEGGTPPFTYTISFDGVVDSVTGTRGSMASQGGFSWTGSAPSAGPIEIYARIADSGGGTAYESTEVDISGALGTSISTTQQMAEVGRPLAGEISVVGGTSPYTYSVTGSDGEAYSGIIDEPGTTAVEFLPRTSGQVTFTLTIQDSERRSSTSVVTVTVATAFTTSLSWSPSLPDAGQPVTVNVTPLGGWGPYSGKLSTTSGASVDLSDIRASATTRVTFANAGTYELTVSLIDGAGGVYNSSSTIIVNPDPSLSIEASQQATEVGVPDTFSLSFSGGAPPFSSTMYLGDGNSSSLEIMSHAYTRPGTYVVNATASDAAGWRFSSAPLTVTVSPQPIVVATAAVPMDDAGHGITFSSIVSYGSPPYTFNWEFGDGMSSTEADPTHTYLTTGLYHVTVSVTDSLGVTSVSQELNVTVVTSPQISISANRTLLDVGEPAAFDSTQLGGATPSTVEWDMGDGTESTGPVAIHSFTSPGRYTVTATLTDPTGVTATSSVSITVGAQLLASIVSNVQGSAEVGTKVTLEESPVGGLGPLSASWSLGALRTSGTDLLNWSFVPQTPGMIPGWVNLTDASGTTIGESFNLQVEPELTLSLPSGKQSGEVGLPVLILPQVSGGVGPFTYTYALPSGTVSGAGMTEAEMTPSQTGRSSVSVTVTDALGCTAQALMTVNVAAPLEIDVPQTGLFADAGTPVALPIVLTGGVGPYSLRTDPSGSLTNGSLLFDSPGSYPISIVASDAMGAVQTAEANLTVSPALTAAISLFSNRLPTDQPVELSVDLSGGHGPFNVVWTVQGLGSWQGAETNVTFPEPGGYAIEAVVQDAAGDSLTLFRNVSAVVDTFRVGISSVNQYGIAPLVSEFAVNLTGGVSPYDFAVSVDGNVIGDAADWSEPEPWDGDLVLTVPGTHELSVSAVDGIGARSNASLDITTCTPLDPPSLQTAQPATTSGVPLELGVMDQPAECGGTNLEVSWWGEGFVEKAGYHATFLSNTSGQYLDHVSEDLVAPDGIVLENQTLAFNVRVGAGAATNVEMTPESPVGTAGANLTLTFLAEDDLGNVNTSYNGTGTLAPLSGGPSIGIDFLRGMASVTLQSTIAGLYGYTVSTDISSPAVVDVRWLADGDCVLIKVNSYDLANSTLFLNVSVTDCYGNGLSNITISAQANGEASVRSNVSSGLSIVRIPDPGDITSVTLTGPGGAATIYAFGDASDPPSPLPGISVAIAVIAAGAVALFLWRRQSKRKDGKNSKGSDRPSEVLRDLLEKWPGEDRASLVEMAEEKRVEREEAEAALSRMERSGAVESFKDDEGVVRMRLAARGEDQ